MVQQGDPGHRARADRLLDLPKEMPRPSRRWAANRYTDIRHWGEPERGGHFPALEQPATFAAEIAAFFGLVR